MRYVTSRLYTNSPEWRAVRHAAMLDDTIETFVVSDIGSSHRDLLINAVPVGSIEFCAFVAREQGVVMPPPLDYPVQLQRFLGRSVRLGILTESAGCFTKPVQTKAFDAFLAPVTADEHRCALAERMLDPNTPCWISEPVLFQQEWRVYVEKSLILGVAQYDSGEADAELSGSEFALVREMIDAWGDAPSAYAIDVGRSDQGCLLLVEINDGWGTGYYPRGSLRPVDYARWCATRWDELGE